MSIIKVIRPLDNVEGEASKGNRPMRVFLGGSRHEISKWREDVINDLSADDAEYVVYDTSGVHNNDSILEWTAHCIDSSDLVVVNIAKEDDSAISFLEFLLAMKENKMVVFCQDGQKNYQCVRRLCDKYMIPIVTSNDIEKIVTYITTTERFAFYKMSRHR